ncbi:cytosolic carboxypeptidase [Acrasis kona]|uniref:Cytosolic carboxypeptidase n=1 Tax=Acrasis kona TaxID=1008807 RepID=A0AAW2ZBZ4_9EUKA
MKKSDDYFDVTQKRLIKKSPATQNNQNQSVLGLKQLNPPLTTTSLGPNFRKLTKNSSTQRSTSASSSPKYKSNNNPTISKNSVLLGNSITTTQIKKRLYLGTLEGLTTQTGFESPKSICGNSASIPSEDKADENNTAGEDEESSMEPEADLEPSGSKQMKSVPDVPPVIKRSESVKKGELYFFSNFESGNLGRTKSISSSEYELYIRPDTNNPNYRLWFYFGVSNMKKGQRVLFSIVNFSKAKSLYRLGMTPLVKSSSRPCWERLPEKQCYYYRMKNTKNYALSFLFEFDKDDEDYYFSYSYPYTYSDLQKFLYNIECRKLPYFKRDLLTRTLQMRKVDLLTITEPENLQATNSKPSIFITSRVHPGESPASFLCHGFISFLVSNHPDAKTLRQNLIFKIVPMLNPDGVFLGNYRCSSIGHDLNRYWLHPEKWAHPTIWHTRDLLLKLKRETSLDFFIDMHAHSSASNAFMYVNHNDDIAQKDDQLAYPKLLDCKEKGFSYNDTRVCRDGSKIGTGRRALGEILQVAKHCYTLEVSFYSFTQDSSKQVPFSQENYLEMGKNVASTFIDYYKLKKR